ncbi:glycosyltransferase [Nocardioides aurantiacus]|uniref:Glycosyltransferase involved in cell wall biosynthesis n=1 Tax=Nocardioides aurantiacus TaxID=86796 RepID=A0A3N2CVI8_9ACTN|nr:glycosyltransferase [Nocardioides aurantiacus]ROR91560.1 glycosyltransferase involved in cell wall biosynthesis [Nocardioides aurantiacus]
MTLRICLIASSRFPVAEPFMGGLEAHTHSLAAALKRRGHEVLVFAGPGSDPALEATTLQVAPFSSSEAARSDVGGRPEQWMAEHHAYLDLMLSLARGDHGHVDVVHNNSLHHLPIAMSRTLPAPLLTTLHTPPIAWLESAAEFAASNAHYVAVSDHLARSWDHVVTAETIPNGIDTAAWRPGPGGPRAVWSGRLVAEKAPHEAIEAARLAGVPLDLVGPAHDPAYFAREVEPRLGAGVRYLGHLAGEPLRRLVGEAGVAVVTPAWDEPFGLVAAEALASGTPVAAYARGALPEIVTPDCGRLAVGGDTASLALAIREAMVLDRAAARRRAVEHFDVEVMVDRYEETYRWLSGVRDAA